MNDEDFFSDDADLDTLGEEQLRALEEEAVRSTQQAEPRFTHEGDGYVHPPQYHYKNPPQHPAGARRTAFKPPRPQNPQLRQQQQQQSNYQRPSTNYVSYSQQQRSAATASTHTLPHQRPFVPPQRSGYVYTEEPTLPAYVPNTEPANHQAPAATGADVSSDYGDIDGIEETADLWGEAPPTVLNAHNEVQEYPVIGEGSDLYQHAEGVQDWIERQEELGQIADDVVMANSQNHAWANAGAHHHAQQQQVDVEAYKAHIAQLEKEAEQMRQQLQQVQQAKVGEVAIVRNKLEQTSRDHERKLASVQKVHAEDEQKKQAEIEALKAERERLLTEGLFRQKELDELVRREKANRKKQEFAALTQLPSQDVAMVDIEASRNRAVTPKKNKGYAHRDGFDDDDMFTVPSPSKRAVKVGTPTKSGLKRKRSANGSPLPQLPLSASRSSLSARRDRFPVVDDMVLEKLFSHDDRLEFFEAIILHRCPVTQGRIFDALMGYSFPSTPNMKISSYFLDKLTTLRTSARKQAFSVGVSRILLEVWARCLEEKFFGPLSMVVELFRFGILWTQGSHCIEVMDEALAILQETVDINAVPLATKREYTLRDGVPTIACLEVLEDIALAALGDEAHIRRFWKQVRVDFPIMCLHPAQPLDVIRRMASILCTSIVGDSFGPITSAQRKHENFLLEAATKPLEMVPRQPSKDRKYSAVQVLELRQTLVRFLGSVCSTESGMLALAKHERTVLRLSMRIAEEVDQCYEWRLGEEIRLDFINFAVRLLHGIITSHPEEATGKLATNHKHLVSMARLAFSDAIAQEAGLDSDAIDCAFSLLENMVTPDEAAALERMFNA